MASVSGGKDSAALSLHLRDLGVEHDRVFLDTGWEHPSTYEYVRGPLTRALGPILEVRGPRTMVDLIRHKGMFPSRQRRFCTQELKVLPMQRHLRTLVDGGDDVVNAVGIRHEESAARARLAEWEWSEGFDCEVWRPLIHWPAEDVVAIHKRHGLRPNPLYLKGAQRVGCWPCIYARKAEVRLVADVDPARIDLLRDLEAEVAAAARARYESERAEWLTTPPLQPSRQDYSSSEQHSRAVEAWEKTRSRLTRPFSPPAWFQERTGRAGTMPIDRAVDWSRTSHGGRQFELFGPDASAEGCMRWGLCETVGEEEAP